MKTKHSLLTWAILITWIQTYLIYKFYFRIYTNGVLDELLLIINSIAPIMLFYGISLLVNPRQRTRMIMGISFLFSVIMIGNALFYKFYDDIMTIPILLQKDNTGGLGSSVMNLIDPKIMVLLLNIPILMYLIKKAKYLNSNYQKSYKQKYAMLMVAFYLLTEFLSFSQSQTILKYTFDREQLMKTLGLYQYGIYDVFLTIESKVDYLLAESDLLIEVKSEELKPEDVLVHPLEGVAEGKNIIMVALESLQTFAIGLEVNGQEVTPFLNDYLEEAYYFDQFYHQTGQGKTSDAEFIIENSLYAANRGSAFFTYPSNTYLNLANQLKSEGYYTAVFHANEKTYWNRDEMYAALGIMDFYDETAFDVTEENSLGWGLKDKEFLLQSLNYMKEFKRPFYAKLITLSNHYPYDLPKEELLIEPADTSEEIVNRYVTTVRYLDESLKVFIEELKKTDLYENSIIVFYGDHYGLSESYNEGLAELLGMDEISIPEHVKLQKVPLYIHLPGQQNGTTISKLSGQIDVLPTLLRLLGIEYDDSIMFGTDIFSNHHANLIGFRDGGFISKDYIYTNSKCYRENNNEEIDLKYCTKDANVTGEDLYRSDLILNGDLLRFEPVEK